MQFVLVYLQWFRRNSLLKCISAIAAWNRETFTKTSYFRVQSRLRSSMLVPPESSSAVLVIISSKSVSICNRSHARRANSGKMTVSLGYPSLMPSFEGNLLTQRHDYAIIRWKPGVSISPGLGLVPGCDRQTDRHTDRITIASTRLALRAVARKN